MSLVRSDRGNSCPVCEDTRGKCRQSREDSDYWQCMTFFDIRKGETHNGYKCIGHTKDGLWAQLKLDNTQEWSEERRLEWQRENERRRQEKSKADDERRQRSLSALQRHEQYIRLFSELTLHPDDKADLVRRGFTEQQIELSGFKSVERYQLLQHQYSELLPGVSRDSRLIVTDASYLCPIRNADGLIVAIQVRLRALKEDDSNRYRWLSGNGQSLHIFPSEDSGGELPLAVFRPPGEARGIALAEGVGPKPFLVAQRLNMLTIGAAGGQFASSPVLLREALEKAADEVGTREVQVFPDAGDVHNSSVMIRWSKAIALLQDWGVTVKVGWWGQVDKSHPDIDELEDYSNLTYLEPEEFLGIEPSKKKEVNKNSSAWKFWINSRRYTPTHRINQRYFEFPHDIPLSNAILAGKDGLGGGKTSALIRLIARIVATLGIGSRLIGYRNTLLHQTISRFQQDAGISYQHLRDDDSFLFLRDKDSHIAFCLDSITHSQAPWFQDTVIVLDETVSVLLHGITAGTIGSRQSECLALLREALRECELVICLDGNLRDIDVELIRKLSGGKEVVKILNEYKREPHKITFVIGVDAEGELKRGDRSPLVKSLLNPDCTPWINCDSKDRALAYAEMLNQVGKTGFVLCSESKNEPWAKEFLLNPTAFIERYKPDYIIVSPSGESGLDCHGNGHFTHKFSFFSGVLSTNAQTQIMFRLRDNIPHYVFCSEMGMVSDRNTPKTYSVKQFEQASNEFSQQSAELVFKISGKDFIQGILESMLSKSDPDYWQYSCYLGALDNFEIDNLRECLVYALQQSGHELEEVEWKICPKTGEWEKAAFETIQVTEAKEIFAAQDIPFDEAQKLKRKDGTKEINRQVQKAFFLNRLPEINQWDGWDKDVIPDDKGFPILVESHEESDYLKGGELLLYLNKTDRSYISALERLWELKNFEVAHKRHEKRWFDFANKDELNRIEARKRGTAFNTLWALKELNLLQFLEGEWCADSPEIAELEEKGHNTDISLALGFCPGEVRKGNPQRIEYLNKLLGLIGCRLDSPVQKGTQNRQRFYKVLKSLKESNLFKKKYQKKEEPIPKSLWWDDWESPLRIALCSAIERRFSAWAIENKEELQWNPESPLEMENQSQDDIPPVAASSTVPSDLMESLDACHDVATFDFIAPCYTEEQIEAAIASQDTQPRRLELRGYWDIFKDAEFLRSIDSWSQATLPQERIDQAWQLIDEGDRQRLHKLYQQYSQQPVEQPVEQRWGITREQAESWGANFEWIRGEMVQIAYAALDYVKLASGEFASYRDLRILT
ncbi:MAG TPA: plasmid replication protein, CyRepA1 family [Waterburya sp.]|jgi:hypothetical protein